MLKKIAYITALGISSISIFLPNTSIAQQNTTTQQQLISPVTLLNDTIVKTQQQLVSNSNIYAQDPQKLMELIETNIMPYLATNVIAQIIVGRDKWASATPVQQKTFIQSLTNMLVNTYASSVAQAGQYEIRLTPFVNDQWKQQRLVAVEGILAQKGSRDGSRIRFSLVRDNSGDWKVYDVSVEGISILKSYQEQFQRFPNLDAINKALETRNASLTN